MKPVRVKGGIIKFRFPCARCGHEMYVPRVLAGRAVVCPECECMQDVPKPPPLPLASAAADASDIVYECGECGYIINGLTKNRCPECGQLFDTSFVKQEDLFGPPTGCMIVIILVISGLVLMLLAFGLSHW